MAADRSAVTVRRLTRKDLPAVLAVQSESYPASLLEDEKAFASRLEAAAPYCLAAILNGDLIGYLVAHGWRRLSPPVLGGILPRDATSEILFVHDVAVGSAGRNRGVARKLLARAFELAARDGLQRAELIAVRGAAGYWRTLGFTDTTDASMLSSKIAAYGSDARLMIRTIAEPGS